MVKRYSVHRHSIISLQLYLHICLSYKVAIVLKYSDYILTIFPHALLCLVHSSVIHTIFIIIHV